MKNITLNVLSLICVALSVHSQEKYVAVSNNQVAFSRSESITKVNGVVTNYSNSDQDSNVPERSKKISKTFPLNNNDRVNLSNQFGSIVIKSWDRNEVKVDIDINAYSDTENNAQKLLDEVSIETDKIGNDVTFKTTISSTNNSFGTTVRNGKITTRREVKISYVVYMPTKNAITAETKYGNIHAPNFSASTAFTVKYGNLETGNLSGSNNLISVEFGNTTLQEVGNVTIKQRFGNTVKVESAASLNLDIQYASANINVIRSKAVIRSKFGNGITIGSIGGDLDAETQYSNLKIKDVKGDANISAEFNLVDIGSVDKFTLKSKHAELRLGTLRGDGNIIVSFKDLIINQLGNGCKNLTIDTKYSTVRLGPLSNYNGSLDVRTRHGGFNYGGSVSAREQNEGNKNYRSEKNYSGKIGNGGNASVYITSEFGSVSIK